MTAVVLTVIAAWLVLAALVTVGCALVTRGGLREDRRRGYVDEDLERLLAQDEDVVIPLPRATIG